MSKLLATFAAITTLIVIGGLVLHETHRPDASKIAFSAWMSRHGKTYGSDEEYLYRLSIFNQNGKYVEEHNKLFQEGVYSFDLELNMFADLTNQEYRDRYLMKDFQVTTKCKGQQAPSDNLPDTVDWSSKGKNLTYVRWCHRNQESRSVRIMLGLQHNWITGGCQLQQEQEPPVLL